jgi:outer membrane protein W
MKLKLTALVALSIIPLAQAAHAEDGKKFYGKLTGGLSVLGDQDFKQTGVAGAGATGTGEYSAGWLAGGALGYRITDNWATEISWDYRNNGTDKTKFTDGSSFNEGDFASNIFFLNGYYRFDPVMNTKFRPYVGAGIGWVQEIDMDLQNAGGAETSYSSKNEFAGQIMAGVEYPIAQNWDFSTEVRYMNVSSINLKQENGAGRINDVDYDPFTVAVGVTYNF